MVRLSVVMAVYNGASKLPRTLDSLAAQSMSDYELIVVDDGSTDDTAAILRGRAAGDARIRVISQSNQGLTRALIAGCAAAQADVIARQDCGDVSMPERFARQLEAMRGDTILTSCFARYVAPEGEVLYEVRADGDSIRESLLHDRFRNIRGLPHHGTAMFRRAEYEQAGGYRVAFRYAQDLDLWMRLARRGSISIVPEVLYEADFDVNAISASRRNEQMKLLAVAAALRDGGSGALLDRAAAIGSRPRAWRSSDTAPALYFIAACLRRNGDPRWQAYAKSAVRRNPFHLRSWLLLLKRPTR